MKHLATIQNEFLKYAGWDDLSYEEQKAYISRHPKTKKKITAKPEKNEVKKNEDRGSLKKVNLDFTEMNDDMKKALKKNNIEMKNFNPNGPGGGNPNADFHGNEKDLKKFLKWYDPDSYEDFVGMMEDDKELPPDPGLPDPKLVTDLGENTQYRTPADKKKYNIYEGYEVFVGFGGKKLYVDLIKDNNGLHLHVGPNEDANKNESLMVGQSLMSKALRKKVKSLADHYLKHYKKYKKTSDLKRYMYPDLFN